MDITLKWKSLKYEIDFETWKAAKVRITENPEILSEAQSGMDAEDVNFCRIKIQEALSHLQEMLYKFLNAPSESGTDEINTSATSWTLSLNLSARQNVNADALAIEAHHYVAYYVLREWAKLALVEMHEAYAARVSEEEQRILKLAYRKCAPTYDA